MRRYAVCLQKKSFSGSTGVLWEIVGVKPFDNGEAAAEVKINTRAVLGVKDDGGPVAFTAGLIVIWQCATWTDDMGAIVEAWANGDLQLRSE